MLRSFERRVWRSWLFVLFGTEFVRCGLLSRQSLGLEEAALERPRSFSTALCVRLFYVMLTEHVWWCTRNRLKRRRRCESGLTARNNRRKIIYGPFSARLCHLAADHPIRKTRSMQCRPCVHAFVLSTDRSHALPKPKQSTAKPYAASSWEQALYRMRKARPFPSCLS